MESAGERPKPQKIAIKSLSQRIWSGSTGKSVIRFYERHHSHSLHEYFRKQKTLLKSQQPRVDYWNACASRQTWD